MLDYPPSPGDIAGAKANFDMGVASCHDIEVLNYANPLGMSYGGCDCVGDFLDGVFNNPPWPF